MLRNSHRRLVAALAALVSAGGTVLGCAAKSGSSGPPAPAPTGTCLTDIECPTRAAGGCTTDIECPSSNPGGIQPTGCTNPGAPVVGADGSESVTCNGITLQLRVPTPQAPPAANAIPIGGPHPYTDNAPIPAVPYHCAAVAYPPDTGLRVVDGEIVATVHGSCYEPGPAAVITTISIWKVGPSGMSVRVPGGYGISYKLPPSPPDFHEWNLHIPCRAGIYTTAYQMTWGDFRDQPPVGMGNGGGAEDAIVSASDCAGA